MPNLKRIIMTISVLGVISLTACAAKDGAPGWSYSYTKVPDAVPKVETLSKKVNPTSYVVNGKRYFVLKTSKGYDKIGTASWYGTKFHGKLTSTGEKYDMNTMTAANKELPIPCYVEVTNLKNNKKAIVKVNDRGPFVTNRIIDLSYAAAQKLGVFATGTAKVRVRAIDPKRPNLTPPKLVAKTTPQKQIKIPTVKPTIYIQIAALQNQQNAKELQQNILKNALFISKIESYTKDKNSTLYKVKIGPFADYKAAKDAKDYLIKNNFAKTITFAT